MITPMSVAEVLDLPALPTAVQAGRALGRGRTKVYEMIHDGEFPIEIARIGTGNGSLRVRRADLLAYLGIDDRAPSDDRAEAVR